MNTARIISIITLLLSLVLVVYAILAYLRCRRGACRKTRHPLHQLDRHGSNPVISPLGHRDWEAEGTFNPGAVRDRKGIIHLFYRALGRDGISRIGHVASADGRHFGGRSPYAVYEPLPGYGRPDADHVAGPYTYDLSAHASGGGWGGSEDPRTVILGNRVYMTYTAFEGWNNMRIAVTSISLDDLEAGKWKWRRPTLISPAGSRAKNWLIFPEKIRGKYAILHGIAPRIRISYVDSPEMPPTIESLGDHGGGGYADPARKGYWDSRVRGAGTPPIRTDLGWLVLYHAIDDRDPKHVVGYKVGAMILDIAEPTRILYRSPEPILSPDRSYENDGKPGVVYATGAVVKDGNLLVYYGGGDRHTCMAETPLAKLLDWLVQYGKVS